MMITGIFINGSGNGAPMNHVHLWTLKSVDNVLSFFKRPHKVMIGILHGNKTAIINTNINSIGFKLSMVRLAYVVVCTIHASDV